MSKHLTPGLVLVSLSMLLAFACEGQGTGGSGDGDSAGDGDGIGTGDGDALGDGDTAGSGGSGLGSGGSGTGSSPSGSGGESGPCANTSPALAVEKLLATTVSGLGTTFATDADDLTGPTDWAPQYGKEPEIVPVSGVDGLAVLYQDQESAEAAYVVQIASPDSTPTVDAIFKVGSLGRIMGLARDTAGNYFVATGVDEDEVVDATYPPNKIHRSGIVRVVKFDGAGCVLMESDVDIERGNQDTESEIIVNPMVAATSRLTWGADQLLLVHGHNTEPDAALDGTRHQKALSTHINALDGTVSRSSTMWVSHSFDQRALFDGLGFVELHLGDAYPRKISAGRFTAQDGDGGYTFFDIKGDEGWNNTYTRLGGIVQSGDSAFGYLALFATERTATTGDALVGGTRDLALVRVEKNAFTQPTDDVVVDEGEGTSALVVNSAKVEVTNHVRWLTDLGADSHAERPRIVAIGGDEYLVLWETWTTEGNSSDYVGTYGMRIDATGAVLTAAKKLSDHHISRGDDAVTVGNKAVYVTGDGQTLRLHSVDSALTTSMVSLP